MMANVNERNTNKQIAIYHNSVDYCTVPELIIDCNESAHKKHQHVPEKEKPESADSPANGYSLEIGSLSENGISSYEEPEQVLGKEDSESADFHAYVNALEIGSLTHNVFSSCEEPQQVPAKEVSVNADSPANGNYLEVGSVPDNGISLYDEPHQMLAEKDSESADSHAYVNSLEIGSLPENADSPANAYSLKIGSFPVNGISLYEVPQLVLAKEVSESADSHAYVNSLEIGSLPENGISSNEEPQRVLVKEDPKSADRLENENALEIESFPEDGIYHQNGDFLENGAFLVIGSSLVFGSSHENGISLYEEPQRVLVKEDPKSANRLENEYALEIESFPEDGIYHQNGDFLENGAFLVIGSSLVFGSSHENGISPYEEPQRVLAIEDYKKAGSLKNANSLENGHSSEGVASPDNSSSASPSGFYNIQIVGIILVIVTATISITAVVCYNIQNKFVPSEASVENHTTDVTYHIKDAVTIMTGANFTAVMNITEKVKRRRTNLINTTLILKKVINSFCKQLLTVEDHLWCMRRKSISIYDQDLEKVNNVQLDDIVYDMIGITRFHSGHVVVACRNTGLHELNPDGQYVAHILNAKVFAVFSFQKAIYAILFGNFIIKSDAVILTQDNSTWVKSQQFKLQFFLWQIKANHNTIYARCLREPSGRDTVFILDKMLNIIGSFLSTTFNLYNIQYHEVDSEGNMIMTLGSRDKILILQQNGKFQISNLKLNLQSIWCISYSESGSLWISAQRHGLNYLQLYQNTLY